MERLEKKIKWEYKMFYSEFMSTSRENIFTKSKEITMKKQIYHHLQKIIAELKPETIDLLIQKERILDFLYLQLCDLDVVSLEEVKSCIEEE